MSVIYPLVVGKTACSLLPGELLFRTGNQITGEYSTVDDWDKICREDLIVGSVVYADGSAAPSLAHSVCFSGESFLRSYWNGLEVVVGTRVALLFYVDRDTNAVAPVEERFISTGQVGMFSVVDDFSSSTLEDSAATAVAELIARGISPAGNPATIDVCFYPIGTVLNCAPCISCTWVQFLPLKSVRSVSFKSNIIVDISCGASYRTSYRTLVDAAYKTGVRRRSYIDRLLR